MRILVTGASGFVGRALCDYLDASGYEVVRAVRCASAPSEVSIQSMGPETAWGNVLKGCEAVIHLAARVHVLEESASDPLAEFREVNTFGTLNLARQAAAVGIRRFLFLSSIKVNGESGQFSDHAQPRPQSDYGISKWEAELGLAEVGNSSDMEVVIIRPPVVYGRGVSANFLRLMRAVNNGVPLPFGKVRNHRSFIYIENLVDAVHNCLRNPRAAGKTYLVADAESVSTPELICSLADSLGRKPNLFSVPPSILKVLGKFLGKGDQLERLIGSLTIDSSGIRRDLDWEPPYKMKHGLNETARWYKGLDKQ